MSRRLIFVLLVQRPNVCLCVLRWGYVKECRYTFKLWAASSCLNPTITTGTQPAKKTPVGDHERLSSDRQSGDAQLSGPVDCTRPKNEIFRPSERARAKELEAETWKVHSYHHNKVSHAIIRPIGPNSEKSIFPLPTPIYDCVCKLLSSC